MTFFLSFRTFAHSHQAHQSPLLNITGVTYPSLSHLSRTEKKKEDRLYIQFVHYTHAGVLSESLSISSSLCLWMMTHDVHVTLSPPGPDCPPVPPSQARWKIPLDCDTGPGRRDAGDVSPLVLTSVSPSDDGWGCLGTISRQTPSPGTRQWPGRAPAPAPLYRAQATPATDITRLRSFLEFSGKK